MRYNIFNQIHKALRALLYDAALLIQQTDFSNAEEAEIAITRVRYVVDYFDGHAEHEDRFVLPAIARYEPSLVDAFEQEHVEDHRLAERLRNLVAQFEAAATPAAKLESGLAIHYAFIAFVAFNLEHMNKEETVLNERLWRFYTDQEIIGINQQIVASIPPAEASGAFEWMIRGMNNAEITGWLKVVQKNAPQPVFTLLLEMAEKELNGERFRTIQENLTEGAMLA